MNWSAMSDRELNIRLTLRAKQCRIGFDVEGATVWWDWRDWRNPMLPPHIREIDMLIDPLQPGVPMGPGTYCGSVTYIAWAESVAVENDGYEALGEGTPRERSELLAAFWANLDDQEEGGSS